MEKKKKKREALVLGRGCTIGPPQLSLRAAKLEIMRADNGPNQAACLTRFSSFFHWFRGLLASRPSPRALIVAHWHKGPAGQDLLLRGNRSRA
jgi:hypothetical protein